MSGLQHLEVVVRSTGRPEAVFDVLADGARWSEWAGPLVPFSSWERSAPEGGLGAVRRLGLGPFATRERIVEHDPPRRQSYELLTWQPYKDYLGEVELRPLGAGTEIVWRAGFCPRVPGTGRLQRLLLERVVGDLAQRLARHTAKP